MIALAYALEILTAAHVRDPRPGGDAAVVRTIGQSLAIRDGDTLTIRACGVSTSRVLGTSTTYSPAFIASAPVVTAPLRVDELGVSVGPWEAVFGAGDDDGDARPGVSVHVDNFLLGEGDVYLTQTSRTLLVGAPTPSGGASGRAEIDLDQTLLGASTWWLRLSTGIRPLREQSEFRLVPIVEPTCAAVVQALAADG